ncbi:MAG TPA: methyltransferase domain-containing protein [Longimicrobiales bacterium]|nr:methyltransferase domain-containing protein [Longimicrobiales bacterium]
MFVDPPADYLLEELLDQYAPLAPVPLCPEISAFQGKSLVQVWEAAERVAGQNLAAPFWAYPWAAGVGLARVVLDRAADFEGRRVLDVGSGGGVAALAAAHADALRVVANDVDPWALAVARIAAHRQRLYLDFLLEDLTEHPRHVTGYDIVLCSDLAYERRTAPRQRALLERARADGAHVLVADAGRTYFSDSGLMQLAEYRLAVPKDLEGVEERVARVFEMR